MKKAFIFTLSISMIITSPATLAGVSPCPSTETVLKIINDTQGNTIFNQVAVSPVSTRCGYLASLNNASRNEPADRCDRTIKPALIAVSKHQLYDWQCSKTSGMFLFSFEDWN